MYCSGYRIYIYLIFFVFLLWYFTYHCFFSFQVFHYSSLIKTPLSAITIKHKWLVRVNKNIGNSSQVLLLKFEIMLKTLSPMKHSSVFPATDKKPQIYCLWRIKCNLQAVPEVCVLIDIHMSNTNTSARAVVLSNGQLPLPRFLSSSTFSY